MSTKENSLEQDTDQLMDEAEKLIWAFLDDQIEEADAKHLEELIKKNEQVRCRYLNLVQIHASLYEDYSMRKQPGTQSPVLSFLSDFSASEDAPSPLGN